MIRIVLILLFISSTVFATEAPSYIVYNYNKQEVVNSSNPDQQRPMASLSKLMTALVIVESNPDWSEKIRYKGNIFYNKQVSKRDLFESLLIRSDNHAAEAFANAWPGGRETFLFHLNARAQSLGMLNTHYDDPSGLDHDNVSSASDLVKLIRETSKYDIIRTVSSSKYFTIEKKIGKKIKSVEIVNTNRQLLFEFDNIILSKTGFTNPAGRCLALMVDQQGSKYIIVILGEKTPKQRADKARHLINDYVTIQESESDKEIENTKWYNIWK